MAGPLRFNRHAHTLRDLRELSRRLQELTATASKLTAALHEAILLNQHLRATLHVAHGPRPIPPLAKAVIAERRKKLRT